MTDPRKAAKEQAEAGFDGFIKYSECQLYALIAFLLVVAGCNFGFEDNSFQLTTANNRLRQILKIL